MSEAGLDDEVHEALRSLVEEVGAASARITDREHKDGEAPARVLALGGGEFLRVELGVKDLHEYDIEAAFERTKRQLRAIRRRWEVARLPELVVAATAAPGGVPSSDRLLQQFGAYLRALASIDRATNAFVIRNGVLVAAAREPDELARMRWPLLARRVLATHAPGSSHGEVVDPDAYAMTFWYDAVLLVLLDEPYALDFVRHRCRLVARELSNLIPLLEPDPEAPAAIKRPSPE